MNSSANRSPLVAVLIGEGALLIQCTQALLDRGFRVRLIISNDPAIAQWTGTKEIPCHPTSADIVSRAKEEPFDYLFSVINYSVLPEELLTLPRHAAINYHDAPLPRYAGLHATSWAIIAGERMHAVSWHRMSKLIDGGDVYKQRAVEISDRETAFSLNGKCYAAAIEAFGELADELLQDRAEAVPQALANRTYFGKFERPVAAAILDWNQPAIELDALVRALDFGVYPNPLGGAKVRIGEQLFLVTGASALPSPPGSQPGIIAQATSAAICVSTSAGELEIRRLTDLDGAPRAIADVIAGCDLQIGSRLPILSLATRDSLTAANKLICRHEEYWVRQLSALQPYVLPLSRRTRTGSGSVETREIPLKLPAEVLSLLKTASASPGNFLAGCLCAFLARIADLATFDIGLRANGLDNERDLEGMESPFSSDVPLRIDIELAKSSSDNRAQIEEQLAKAKKHLTYSRDAVARFPRLRNLKNLQRSQKFPVVLDLTESPKFEPLPTGVELGISIEQTTAECRWRFDAATFDPEIIQQVSRAFTTFLSAIAQNPDCAIEDLPLMTVSERQRFVTEFNQPRVSGQVNRLPSDGGATLHALFESQVERTPGAIAQVCDEVALTYRELNRRANRLARHLRKRGVRPDVLVGLCLNRANDLVVGLLAILKAGGAYLPIDLAYPADRLAFMLEDAQAPILLTQRVLLGTLPPTKAEVICVDEILSEPGLPDEESNLPATAGSDNLAYVIYTSGTTGKPKGSLITHRNVVRLFASTDHWFGFNERDVWTLFHSTAFDFSVWEIWGALLYGGRLVVVPFMVSRSPEAFYELLAKESVTVLNQTPSAFRQLIQAEESVGQKPLALRYVIFGGEALEMQSLRPWYERHGDKQPQLVNMYGITETTVHVTYRPLSQSDLASGSVIGAQIPDLQIYILDRKLQPMPIGVPGEMYVGGAGLCRGYLGRPDLTAARFIPDHLSGRSGSRLYKTGDLARFLPDRDIEYLGRIDHQVKIRGFRVELGEIESVLCQHQAVREAIVLTREDSGGGKRLVAYVVAQAPVPAVSELRDRLRKKLPDYMVPAAFVFLEKLPLTNNGKIDRQALPEPEQDRPELAAAYVAPRNESETKLADIWSRVLRLERIGINDNFFELGGDSILSIQIISLARQVGLALSPKLLFQHPTVAGLAAAAVPAHSSHKIEQGLIQGSAPFTPIQQWFLDQNLAEPHWYNQTFLFELSEPLNVEVLREALARLEQHHDALRLRLPRGVHSEQVLFGDVSLPVPLDQIDLSTVRSDELDRKLQKLGTSAQSKPNLALGPLWRAVYCDLGGNRPHRLLLVIHHLAIDGVSWRILLEDLGRIYQQLSRKEPVRLSPKTTSVKEWAERLREMGTQIPPALGRDYWHQTANRAATPLPVEIQTGENTEGSTNTVTLRLESIETESLLKRAPGAYNTQINDLLLTALARAVKMWTGSNSVSLNLEGHGREDLFDGVDLSRTLGWFTSIYPVHLDVSASDIGPAIKAVKEQLRAIPSRGIGYGILRFLARDERLRSASQSQILFNYLGQLDQLVQGSRLFRFAAEKSGPWHSPHQVRNHLIEINCAVVRGRLEIALTYSRNRHLDGTMETLAAAIQRNLRDIVEHCTRDNPRGFTPSDFPLADLDQATLDSLVARLPNLEDVYPLTPVQALFYAVGANDARTVTDRWHGTLNGPLDLESLRTAWQQLTGRHTILRTSFQSAGLKGAVQVVHRTVDLPWRVEDWRERTKEEQEKQWTALLEREYEQGVALDQAPPHRVIVVRLTNEQARFLWIAPALLLDGWSWPVVFRDLSTLYGALRQSKAHALPPVRPYRDSVVWLRQRSHGEDEQFWRAKLKGVTQPTPLTAESGDAPPGPNRETGSWTHTLDAVATTRLLAFARQLQITPNTLILAAWGLVLSRLSGRDDITFGAAFSGRSTELADSGNIVGPFVNNVPVRVTVERNLTLAGHLKRLHTELLDVNLHQFAPLAQIQSWSEVPWRDRLFESLVVVQNYEVDESARRLGNDVAIAEFSWPIHTAFPLLVLIEPGDSWRITLIHDRRELSSARVAQWGQDLVAMLKTFPTESDATLDKIAGSLSAPATKLPPKARLQVRSLNYVPPQTNLQRAIVKIWEEMFQIDRISVEENLFDLGAHSLLVTKLHQRLKESLGREFSLVNLFQYPTIAALARYLDVGGKESVNGEIQSRAQQQREALARMRRPGVRK